MRVPGRWITAKLWWGGAQGCPSSGTEGPVQTCSGHPPLTRPKGGERRKEFFFSEASAGRTVSEGPRRHPKGGKHFWVDIRKMQGDGGRVRAGGQRRSVTAAAESVAGRSCWPGATLTLQGSVQFPPRKLLCPQGLPLSQETSWKEEPNWQVLGQNTGS